MSVDAGILEADALAWARRHVEVEHVELVRRNDWARTYRLSATGQVAFLKLVPPQRIAQLARTAAIAERFPRHTPTILAVDTLRGRLLVAHHGGQPFDVDADPAQLRPILRSLAAIQAEAARDAPLLRSLERFDPQRVIVRLKQFLRRAARAGDGAAILGAADLIGDAAAGRYRRLFEPRMALLARHVQSAEELPPTVLHGDLHAGNSAIRDGTCVLIDWDECAAGPAGSCLHSLFDGCTIPAILLARWAAGGAITATTGHEQLLADYVDRLATAGYAPRETLLRALGGAACAGQIRHLLSYGDFASSVSADSSARAVVRLLSNLLDLCDWLCASEGDSALDHAADYERRREWPRAQRLLQDQVARAPARVDLVGRYAQISRKAGDTDRAIEAALEAIRLAPDAARWHLELALARLAALDLTGSRAALDAAIACDPGCSGVHALQRRLARLRRLVGRAADAGGWPQLAVSRKEQAAGQLDSDNAALLVALFREHGVVQVDGVFAADFIDALHRTFRQRHAQHGVDGRPAEALCVGDRRYMLTMTLDDQFGAHDLVASNLLLPSLRRILGEECILSAYTAVVSLPGSAAQRPHKDHSALFEEQGWNPGLPSFAAQVIVPLVRMDSETGTTRIVKGSKQLTASQSAGLAGHDPIVPVGSCLLVDYALVHQGLANRSPEARPILNLVFSRPWFRDIRNYHRQPPLRLAPGFLDSAPAVVRRLVAWWELERQLARAE